LDEESMIGGRLQAGCRADGTVYISSQTAAAADDMVVVVSHPCLIASRMPGRLDASDEASRLQNVQIVVYGLSGECAESLARGICDGVRIPVLLLA
jgi:hypothetical protein